MPVHGRLGPVTRLALHLDPALSIGEAVERARQAEAAGVDAVYGIEGLGDVFVPMAAIAAATTTIGIGTYVANAYARTPQAAAMAARDIDELSGGRFTFGVGAGNRHVNEWFFGLDSSRPMEKMRDYLTVVGALLGGAPVGAALTGRRSAAQSITCSAGSCDPRRDRSRWSWRRPAPA